METPGRSTKEIITPGGNKVVMYDYITGNEARAVIRLTKMSEVEGAEFSPDDQAMNYAFDALLRSIDGKTENLSKVAGDLPVVDYSAIAVAITELIDTKKN